MATTTNYGWTTPDDTALVKDGASAIRTLGTSVDTTTKNLNPSTTLGDIEYRSSTSNTNTRLGIGSTGNVLTVAGGVPTWAAPAGGGANYSLLNSGGTALTGAQTITVSGISAKDKIFIILTDASSASAYSVIKLRLNTDTGSNYTYEGFRMEAANTYNTDISNISTNGSSNDTGFTIASMSSAASSEVFGYVKVEGANSSGIKIIHSAAGVSQSGGQYANPIIHGGTYTGSSTITSISIFSSTGNFDNGTVFVYTSA
jgi:hypothetical protein